MTSPKTSRLNLPKTSKILRKAGFLTLVEDRFLNLLTDPLSPSYGLVGLSFFMAAGYGDVHTYNKGREEDSEDYRSSHSRGSAMLKKEAVFNKLKERLETSGFMDTLVDLQLTHVINQNGDLGVKLKGIQEYNKMKNRVTERHDVSVHTDEITEEQKLLVAQRILNKQ